MTEWYYSDASRNRYGPVSEEELAALHANGALKPDTLVWREGMNEWRPWRDVIPEVVYGAEAKPADGGAIAAVSAAAPAVVDDGAYRPYAIAETSPYAPPQARVDEQERVVRGGRVVHAGFWKRFAASVIDSVVTTALVYAIQIPLMILFGIGMSTSLGSGDDPFSSGAGIAVLGLIYLISLTIPLMYFSWMHSSKNQASLGKMAIGIKVTRSNGERISFWRAFGRYWAFLLSYLILAIGLIMAGITERKQGLHDMICDTLVVDKYAYTDHPEWQRDELGTVTIVILALFGLLFVGIVVMFAGMAAILGSGLR